MANKLGCKTIRGKLGFFCWACSIAFLFRNAQMLIWVVAGASRNIELVEETATDAKKAGAIIGSVIGVAWLLVAMRKRGILALKRDLA